MMDHLWAQILLGFTLGCAASGLKYVLTDRFFLKGSTVFTVFAYGNRLLLDVLVLFLMRHWMPALLAAAIGLMVDRLIFARKIRDKRGD